MSNLEFNKIFAAVLIAGIVGMLSGFIAKKVVAPEKLKEDAFPVEVADNHGGAKAAAKPKGPEPVLAMIAEADITRGEKLSKACAACHSFDKGGANRIGPNLWNVFNAPKGAHDGFTYSSTMAAFGGQWGYQELNHFLWKPKDYMAGTKMNYIGLRKVADRAAMIAWLRTLHDNPAPLPSAEAIAAEAPEEIVDDNAADDAVEDVIETIEDTLDTATPDVSADAGILMDPRALNAIETAAGNNMERITATPLKSQSTQVNAHVAKQILSATQQKEVMMPPQTETAASVTQDVAVPVVAQGTMPLNTPTATAEELNAIDTAAGTIVETAAPVKQLAPVIVDTIPSFTPPPVYPAINQGVGE